MKKFLVFRKASDVVLAGALAVLSFSVDVAASEKTSPKIIIQDTPLSRVGTPAGSFAPIIKKAAPSVVNIYTTKTVREGDRSQNPLLSDPFFRRFFGDDLPDRSNRRPRTRQEQSLGSGVIVSEDGYILTNNHVVDEADEIKISLASGGSQLMAKVVGTDPPTDLAVLKVDGSKLPAITLTDSDKLEVGDIVLAIGNPFSLGQTVTMGIVSAMGRGGFNLVDYEDFIQTDASINPGNSGGALVDAEGRLVGINTFIISGTGGNMGVGFAVPSNLARFIMERIAKDGKVVRGFLGVKLQPLTPDMASEFGVTDQSGALIAEVSPNTPAEEAGLKEGDVIMEFNGKKVTDTRHLRLMVAQTPPKTKVTLKVIRSEKEKAFKEKTFNITLEEFPEELAKADRRAPSRTPEQDALEGVELGELDARARRQFGIPNSVKGALVTNVEPGSAAEAASLSPGDVIVEVRRQPVRDANEVIERLRQAKAGTVLLRVWSQGGSRYVILDTGAATRRRKF